MSIKVGDKLPSVTVKHMTAEGLQDLDTADLFTGKKVVLFGVPGAFTPTCHKEHLPGYVAKADELKGQGIEDIICMTVNDPFVVHAWAEAQGTAGKVTMLPDGNGAFTEALGLGFDASGAGLGTRVKRFSAVVEDGVVKTLNVEENPGKMVTSGADTCLTGL